MKRLLITTAIFISALLFWMSVGTQHLNRDTYLTQNILDMSRPVDVSIDIDFLKGLGPAYEQR